MYQYLPRGDAFELSDKCDTRAGSYISLGILFPGVFGTSCLDTRSKKR